MNNLSSERFSSCGSEYSRDEDGMKGAIISSDPINFSLSYKFGNAIPQLKKKNFQTPDSDSRVNVTFEYLTKKMGLLLCNILSDRDILCAVNMKKGFIAFTVILSGIIECDISSCKDDDMNIFQKIIPCEALFKSDEFKGSVRICAGMPFEKVTILVETKKIVTWMKVEDFLFFSLSAFLKKKKTCLHLLSRHPGPDTRLIATQILRCTMTGLCRKLFLESKCLELISLFFNRMKEGSQDDIMSITEEDKQRLYKAKRILVENMRNPPGLRELSHMCGVNEYKLKKGFRQLFGLSVYESLRKERMYKAKDMLNDSNSTVGIVSDTVGYNSISRFIDAFRNEFGITPGRFLFERRKSR